MLKYVILYNGVLSIEVILIFYKLFIYLSYN